MKGLAAPRDAERLLHERRDLLAQLRPTARQPLLGRVEADSSSGSSNPTLTIVALALRQAEHTEAAMKRGEL